MLEITSFIISHNNRKIMHQSNSNAKKENNREIKRIVWTV